MKLNLDEEWYKRWMSVDDSVVGVGGLSSFSTCNSNSTEECTYENLTRIMKKVKDLMPEPAFERVVMLQSHYEALKKAAPQDVSSASPAIQYGFLGLPIEVYPTREEAAKLSEELAQAGVRVMLCVDRDKHETQQTGDSVSPDGM